MSKAERLHRWAASLELHRASTRHATARVFHARERQFSRNSERSPLSVAFEDWAFQAEGLRSASWGDIRAFFALSEAEMRHVLRSAHDSHKAPAAVAAARIRALAERADETAVPERGSLVAGGGIGPWFRGSGRFPSATGQRRETAGAA